MKIDDYFTYDNQIFASLREPAREVVAAYQNAARFLDTIQESIYIESGMIHAARIIHNLAHEMPKRFDDFGDMLHERHLTVEYPPTPELTEEIRDMDAAFEATIKTLDAIDAALKKFCVAANKEELQSMTLKAEDLMRQNSKDYTAILEMWKMWDESGSPVGFDNWAINRMEGGNE